MAQISWTVEAERWLRDINDYIAEHNPQSATRVIQGLIERVHILCQFPELGHRYDRHPDRHIRILLDGHYRIAYLIKLDGDIDVFHGAIDIDRYLF